MVDELIGGFNLGNWVASVYLCDEFVSDVVISLGFLFVLFVVERKYFFVDEVETKDVVNNSNSEYNKRKPSKLSFP